MLPYLKGHVKGECPRCDGTGQIVSRAAPHLYRKCPTCKGRKIVGKTPEEVIAEMRGHYPDQASQN